MSLVQHVSAIDGIDREPEAEETDFLSIRRKISYDILQPNEGIPVAELRPGTPAYEHSPTKRLSTNPPQNNKNNLTAPQSKSS